MTRPVALGLLVASVLCGCDSRLARPALTVRVVDETSGRPMPGVTVMYGLQTALHCKSLLPHELDTRWAHKAVGVTDERGEVRLAIGEVALGFNECFLGEQIMVNVHVDMAARSARDISEILSSNCRREEETCGGPVTEFDVAHLAMHSSCGEGVLAPEWRSHEGRVLLLEQPGRYKREEIDTRCGGWLGTRLHETSRTGAEVIEVKLTGVK